jgi:serine/threonine-protein phosphatase 2A regulatory subunit A
MEGSESLHPIAVLVTELKAEDVTQRVRSLSQLSTISIALGPERTQSELLPYLTELIDDDPPVQLELAKQLSAFTTWIGGPNYAHLLLDPLEMLATVESGEVRSVAVRGIVSIAETVNSQVIGEIVLDVAKSLAEAEGVPARCSAAMLLPLYYSKLGKTGQNEALELFEGLGKDSDGQVRKAAADSYPTLVSSVGLTAFDILGLFASDREDSIRAAAIHGLLALAPGLPAGKRSSLLSTLRTLCEDKAMRVRYAVAEHMHELGTALGADICVQVLSPLCVRLLSDSEVQVRTALCAHIGELVGCMSPDQAAVYILPAVASLTGDAEVVKKTFSAQLSKLANHIGSKLTHDYLLPSIQSFLKDDSLDISLSLLTGALGLSHTLDPPDLKPLLNEGLNRTLGDVAWRTRLQVCELLPAYARDMGAEDFYDYFGNAIGRLATDSVYTVRDAIVQKITEIAKTYGENYTEERVLPIFLTLKQGKNYIYRVTLLKSIASLASFVSPGYIKATIVPVLIDLSKDRVPHVRLNVGKAISSLKPLLPSLDIDTELRKISERLTNDPDKDVRNSVLDLFPANISLV